MIGAGVIGLAVARALAAKGKEVLVLERASTIGSGQYVYEQEKMRNMKFTRYLLTFSGSLH